MEILKNKALAFDDVLLLPQYSEVKSRKDVNVSTRISKNLSLNIPIISSCMNTVTEENMAIAMWKLGGLGILHRYNSIDEQLVMFRQVWNTGCNCAVAVGVNGDFFERTSKLIDCGVNIICIDVAHGHHILVKEALTKIRQHFPDITIIAGNVATGEGTAFLLDYGADAIRLSIGGGSLCTSRLVAGSGLSTLQSLLDAQEFLYKNNYKNYCLLADGGVRNAGDIVKSIAAGAGGVILGQLLAATDEAPGQNIYVDGKAYKKYFGMASRVAQVNWRPEKTTEVVPEGEETLLPHKGSVEKVIYQLIGGLRSGMSYSGANSIEELQQRAKFVQITSAGWAESKPHAKKEGF